MDNPQATFAVGDVKFSWDWITDQIYPHNPKTCYLKEDVTSGKVELKPGWTLETHCVNDFSYTKRTLPYLHIPLCFQPDWAKKEGVLGVWAKKENYPVQKAFRTAGLVRGAYPYALVVDDIQKDTIAHDYRWNMALEHDVQIASVQSSGEHQMDVLLTGSDPQQKEKWGDMALPTSLSPSFKIPTGQPVLLIRFLNLNHEPATASPTPTTSTTVKQPVCDIVEDRIPIANQRSFSYYRTFSVKVHAVSPDFKVLLYAFHQGDALPQTTWNGNQTVSVSWPNQQDQITFALADSGKTKVTVKRSDQTLVTVNHPLPELPAGAVINGKP